MTNILLCGANGRMGHMLEKCLSARENMRIVAGIDINTNPYSDFPIYDNYDNINEKIDVIIDFSHPSALDKLLGYAEATKTPVVIASTGYDAAQIEKIKKAALHTPIFFTFNMSLGINLLVDLAKRATAVLSDQFDIEIIEKHHNQKLDAPSGTAIMIANAVNEAANERYQYEYDRHSRREKRGKSEIGIHSVRGGTIVGEHELLFAGQDETLSIKHTASSREVFGVGAVNAALFLCGKEPGIYDMSDLLAQIK